MRFTIRRMMAAVAVAALILGAGRLLSVSAMYRNRADQFAAEDLGDWPLLMGPGPHVVPPPSARIVWAREMADKYWRASWFPWLPVEPDPPPPPEESPRSRAGGTGPDITSSSDDGSGPGRAKGGPP